MIFATLGTHNQGFDRLARAIDMLAAASSERVVVQRGRSKYEPLYAEWFDFADTSTIEELSKEARVIVTHAGAGSILTSLQAGVPVVVVPRTKAFGEHTDDHQLELATALHDEGRVHMVTDVDELAGVLASLDGSVHETIVRADVSLVPYLKQRLSNLEDGFRRR